MRKTTIFLAAQLLVACHDDQSGGKSSKSAEEARIEREVTQRVAVVEKDLKVRQHTLHTIRVVGFILLAGGALGGLIWLQSHHRSFNSAQGMDLADRRPEWSDHYGISSSRVLELPPPGQSSTSPPRVTPDERFETTQPRRRRRRRHRNPRNHDYHETPNHS